MKILLSENQISDKVKELGAEIDRVYNGEPLVIINLIKTIVCVLKGASIFMADLIRSIRKSSLKIEFVAISSYGDGMTSSGNAKLITDIRKDILNENVLIVEDIFETGITLGFLTDILRQRLPKSLKIVTFLEKMGKSKVNFRPDFVGFQIGDEFVVGYGLDYAEKYRELPYIGIYE